MFALLPMPYRILIAVIGLGAAWALGDLHGHKAEADVKDVEIAQKQHAFDERIHTADVALAAANDQVAKIDTTVRFAVDTAVTNYRSTSDAEKKALTDRVAALSSGRERMRVDAVCRPDARSSGQAAGAPATAAGSDGAASYAELSSAAAGRLAAVAGRADEIARALGLAQDTIRAYYAACGPQAEVAAPPEDPTKKKRGVLKLGAPNPFDR